MDLGHEGGDGADAVGEDDGAGEGDEDGEEALDVVDRHDVAVAHRRQRHRRPVERDDVAAACRFGGSGGDRGGRRLGTDMKAENGLGRGGKMLCF